MTSDEEYEAKELYVLLRKGYRISRNIRLKWFFDNIFKDVARLPFVYSMKKKDLDPQDHEIQILSIIRKSQEHASQETFPTIEENKTLSLEYHGDGNTKCSLLPSTKVYFISRGYRLVFALDLSPSIYRVDAVSSRTIAEGVLDRLANCLCSLMIPFKVPGCQATLKPNIYVTVIAQTRPKHQTASRYKQNVLVQGSLLTPQSVQKFLKMVECKIYHRIKRWTKSSESKDTSHTVKHDHGLVSILRAGLMALQLLPTNTTSGIVVITDGIVGMPDMAVLETLLSQLRSTTTHCSFLCVPRSKATFCDFSYCVNVELLQFIAEATMGTCFGSDCDTNFEEDGMNKYQKSLLLWQFQMDKKCERSGVNAVSDVRSWDPGTDLRYTPNQKTMSIAPILRKKHYERMLRVSILAVLSVRLREGYMISSVSLNKNQSQIEVKLVFPWNHGTTIKYNASTGWPIVKNNTKVEVFIEASYEFLSDLTVRIERANWSRYRAMVVRRFNHFMKGLAQTDQMLTHLLSFATDSVHYTLVQKHVPLFYLPPNSNQLVLSMQAGNDSSLAIFSSYWKPILSLDVNIWQRWLHTHRIEVILQHDQPLSKHLHLPTKNGRYHSVQTSSALSQLTSLLRDWSTFVLLENHSYVKFICKDDEDVPSSFYLIRLSTKAPVIVIRLAFLIGTTGQYRNQVLSELRDRVLSLAFPVSHKQTPSGRNSGMRSRNTSSQTSRARPHSGSDCPSAVMIHKPLERILIRYDQTPRDFTQLPSTASKHGKMTSASTSSKNATAGGEVGLSSFVQDLCQYLEHRRWVWSITNKHSTSLSVAVAGQMANLLVKLRLSEGFNFANSSSGVITMVREFPMKLNIPEDGNEVGDDCTHYCLVQYIVFPPTTCTTRESFSLDDSCDEEEDTAESDGDLLLATEVWIEPQCGSVVLPNMDMKPLTITMPQIHSSGISDGGRYSAFSSLSSCLTPTDSLEDPQNRFVGCGFQDIPRMLSDEDSTLLNVMVTIEHLRLMCLPQISSFQTLPQTGFCGSLQKKDSKLTTMSSEHSFMPTEETSEPLYRETSHDVNTEERIKYVPSLFDLVGLLERSPRIKLLFMALSEVTEKHDRNISHPNEFLFNYFHQSLVKLCAREAQLSEQDCAHITKHMIKRGNENMGLGLPHTSMSEEEPVSADKWKCYLSIFPRGKVLVMLLPAIYKDLQSFSTYLPGFGASNSDRDANVCSNETLILPPADVHAPMMEVVTQDEDQDLNDNSQKFNQQPDYRLARRLSIKRMNSQLSSKSNDENIAEAINEKEPETNTGTKTCADQQLNLPVFIYECSTQALVEQLLKDPSSKPNQWDVEQDHRPSWIRYHGPSSSPSKLVVAKGQGARNVIKSIGSRLENMEQNQRPGQLYRSVSEVRQPTLSPTKNTEGLMSPTAEDVFTNFSTRGILDPEISNFCDSVVDVFHRSFVLGIFHSLQVNGSDSISSVDIQAATDAICRESVQEIDITQFLLITCPQVAAFKERNTVQANSQDLMNQNDPDDVFCYDSDSSKSLPNTRFSVRNSSTTSSSADPSNADMEKRSINRRGMADSRLNLVPDENQDKQIEVPIEACNLQTTDSDVKSSTGKSSTRSAFKKPRKRPRTPTKIKSSNSKDIVGTDEHSEMQSLSSEKPKLISRTGSAEHAKSLMRSLKVSKPLKKLAPAAKIGWDHLPEFPLDALKECHPRHISGSDDQVKMSFQKILSQNFRPLQSLPDLFYYHPQATSCSDEVEVGEEQDHQIIGFETELAGCEHIHSVTESDQEVRFELLEQDENMNKNEENVERCLSPVTDIMLDQDLASSNHNKLRRDPNGDFDSASASDDEVSLSKTSCSSSENSSLFKDKSDDNCPLFLCMTCTVRDKKTGNHGTMPIDGLHSSLATVLSYLEKPCTHIDLSQLCITLDLIWVMLPTESRSWRDQHSSIIEQSSSQSDLYSGLLPDEDDSPRNDFLEVDRKPTINDDQVTFDPLISLSSACSSAVKNTKDQIEWLLRDEIICALRTCETITSETLEKVTNHVEELNSHNSMKKTVNLQFVFGTEKSLPHFTAEFEKTFKDFKGYRIKKEGPYYYLITERTFLPIQNWPDMPILGKNENLNKLSSMSIVYSEQQSSSSVYPCASPTRSTPVAVVDRTVSSLAVSGLQAQDSSYEKTDHKSLRRAKTVPSSLKSPPVKTCLDFTSFHSLPGSSHSLSSRSLPGTEEPMSIAAIESDVCLMTSSGVASKQQSVNQSTPVRKILSEVDVSHSSAKAGRSQTVIVSSSDNKQSGRNDKSRLSLPSATELHGNRMFASPPSQTDGNENKQNKTKKKSLKQRSVEREISVPAKLQTVVQRKNSHSITPGSLRNSPQPYSGPNSPQIFPHLSTHNSSFGSNKSAPMLQNFRRVSHSAVTPVSQTLHSNDNLPPTSSTVPNFSTPMLRRQISDGPFQNVLTYGATSKDIISSPVSVSDSELRRHSTASWFESGYDGEVSESEGEDDYMSSLQDGSTDLPNFWLVISVQSEVVKLYFHRRNSAPIQHAVDSEHKRVFNAVIDRIHSTCKRVNQMLLLQELLDSRMCNPLLVEETEEDIWKRDYNPTFYSQMSTDHGDDNSRQLLAATMTIAPGQFACECVMEKLIPLHPRLKSAGVKGKSSVVAMVRDLVRNLMVTNRKDMFVFLLPDKSVFYCRMEEDSPAKGDSRRSSLLFQSTMGTSENVSSSAEVCSITPERKNSKESLSGFMQTDAKTGGTLILCWHGVSLPTPQQQEELEKMNQSIKRKLDESVLEKITVLLQRKSKLSPEDVIFIQPSAPRSFLMSRSPAPGHFRPVVPDVTISFGLPNEVFTCIPAVRYYLHQNLLQFMAVPRYTDPVQGSNHFTLYTMSQVSDAGISLPSMCASGDGSLFLFHQLIEPGKTGYGIACVVLEVTDKNGNQLTTDPILQFSVPENASAALLTKLTTVKELSKCGDRSLAVVKAVSPPVKGSFSRPDTPAYVESNKESKDGQVPKANQDDTATNEREVVSKAVVRFHLWLKGTLTVDHLIPKLKSSIQFALCDNVTELFVLRPPLCVLEKTEDPDDVPPIEFHKSKRLSRFTRKLSLPNPSFLSHSAPVCVTMQDDSHMSLSYGKKAISKHPVSHSPLSRVQSTPAEGTIMKTDAMRSLFGSSTEQSPGGRGILSSILHSRLDSGSNEDERTKQLLHSKPVMASKPCRSKSVSMKVEEGEVGCLKNSYKDLSEEWFKYLVKNDSPAVFQMTMALNSSKDMEKPIIDIQNIFASALSDCRVKVFIQRFGSCTMIPYFPDKAGKPDISCIPGRYPSYILIARNFALWRKAIGCFSQHGQVSLTSALKFPPFDSASKPEQSPRPQEHRLITPCSAYIPRQQFLLLSIKKRTLTVQGYNVSTEIARNLQKGLRFCMDFHNARHRMVLCLVSQKLGLTRHCTLQNEFSNTENNGEDGKCRQVVVSPVYHRQYSDPNREQDHVQDDGNPFLQDVKDVDILLHHSSLPSERQLQFVKRTKQSKRVFFYEAYTTNYPRQPLNVTKNSTEKNLPSLHAAQYLDLKSYLKKRGEEQQLLNRVFSNWKERPTAHSSITKDVLKVLLQHSRMIHHVSSPILFSPAWRRVFLKLKALGGDTDGGSTDAEVDETQGVAKKQNRQSGNFRKSGDFSEHKSRSRSNSTRKESIKDKSGKSGNTGGLSSNLESERLEESKCDIEDLRWSLMTHYMHYWQSMHFLLVREEKNGRQGKSRKANSDESSQQSKRSPSVSRYPSMQKKGSEDNDVIYLYRVASGGIVLVEISFIEMNFLVKLYILETSRLQYLRNFSQQMSVLFLNECEHLKDYTHVHSFSYDFHLRYVQWYIQDRQTAIKPGYHLVGFLQDFVTFYKQPPVFSFNHIYNGSIEVSCSHVTPDELYEYIVGKQASRYGFKPLKLTDRDVERNEHALVSSSLLCRRFHDLNCNIEDHDMYDVCYVVSHRTGDQRNSVDANSAKTMKLKFFILFTNRRHLFPRFDLQDNLNPLQTPQSTLHRNLHSRSGSFVKSTDKGAVSAHQVTKSNSMSLLNKAKESATPISSLMTVRSPTSAQSPLSLIKSAKSADRGKNLDDDITGISSSSFSNTMAPISALTQAKKKLQSRRQSMPNCGTMQQLKLGQQQHVGEKRPKNLAGHTIKMEANTQNVGLCRKESELLSFIQCEIKVTKEFLTTICNSAEIQCYRNKLWDKVFADKSAKESLINIKDFEHLLKHVQKVPMSKLDPRGSDLCNVEIMGMDWAVGLQKHIQHHFPQICRTFANSDNSKCYLGVLNPKLYDMMVLIVVDTALEEIGMFVVMRDKIEELEKESPNLTNGSPNLIFLKGHLDNILNFMCFHTWKMLMS